MLVLSDLAGSGGSVGEDGYLTGYPLPESGHYVLAKTWLAPEMRRPGCVWTHSLIIDRAHLDAVSRHSCPDGLFVRPDDKLYDAYRSPLLPHLDDGDVANVPPSQETLVRAILSALYTHPNKSIFLTEGDFPAASAVMVVWAQQWLTLKARFRFCTSVAAERSADGLPFDLQVMRKGVRNTASVLKNSLDVRKLRVSEEPWLAAAVDDLVDHSQGLSKFLDDCGSVLVEGRDAFVPLATLFCFLKGSPFVPGSEAMKTLEHPAAQSLPNGIKLSIIKRAVLVSNDAFPDAIDAMLDHLDQFNGDERKEIAAHIGPGLLRHDVKCLLEMLEGDGSKSNFASEIINQSKIDDVLQAMMENPAIAGSLLDHRPDLMTNSNFVSSFPNADMIISKSIGLDISERELIIEALIRSNRDDFDMRRLRTIDVRAFWKSLQGIIADRPASLKSNADEIIRQLCMDTTLITNDLSNESITSTVALEAICNATRPDQILNDYGEDPWLIALKGIPKGEKVKDNLNIMAYSLCRGLGWRSRQPLDLAAISFSSLYKAAKHDSLPASARHLLDAKLQDSFISRWDMCKRLRRTVADLFIDKRGSPEIYINLLKDDKDFLALAEETSSRIGGRTYLKDVRRYLRNYAGDEKSKFDIIDRTVG